MASDLPEYEEIDFSYLSVDVNDEGGWEAWVFLTWGQPGDARHASAVVPYDPVNPDNEVVFRSAYDSVLEMNRGRY